MPMRFCQLIGWIMIEELYEKVKGAWRFKHEDGCVVALKFFERNVIYHTLSTNGKETPFEDYFFGVYRFLDDGKLLVNASQEMAPIQYAGDDYPYSLSSVHINSIKLRLRWSNDQGELILKGFERLEDDEIEKFKYFDPKG